MRTLVKEHLVSFEDALAHTSNPQETRAGPVDGAPQVDTMECLDEVSAVIKPTLEELLDQVDNKYALVIATAKRARQIKDGGLPMVDVDSANPVTVALEEIATGKIRVEE